MTEHTILLTEQEKNAVANAIRNEADAIMLDDEADTDALRNLKVLRGAFMKLTGTEIPVPDEAAEDEEEEEEDEDEDEEC